jgi:cytochrome c oxidase assembly factor CtaG
VSVVAPSSVLLSWRFQPLVILGLDATAAAYVWGFAIISSRPGRPFPRWRATCFLSGIGVAAIALLSPVDVYADRLLSVHMVQHILLTMVAAPLMVLGAPVMLALRASTRSVRARVLLPLLDSHPARFITHPVVCWGAFTAALWTSHFTPLYQAALESEVIHGGEHLLYLVTGVMFWWPVVGVEPSQSRISHPARLLYVFLAMPQTSFLGLAIYSSDRVLYPHYVAATAALGRSALSDQHLAGVLMWTSSMVLFLPVMALVLFDWMSKEAREAGLQDARLARGRSAQERLAPPSVTAR